MLGDRQDSCPCGGVPRPPSDSLKPGRAEFTVPVCHRLDVDMHIGWGEAQLLLAFSLAWRLGLWGGGDTGLPGVSFYGGSIACLGGSCVVGAMDEHRAEAHTSLCLSARHSARAGFRCVAVN